MSGIIVARWVFLVLAPIIVSVIVLLMLPTLANMTVLDTTTQNMVTSTGTALEDFTPILAIIAIAGGVLVIARSF